MQQIIKVDSKNNKHIDKTQDMTKKFEYVSPRQSKHSAKNNGCHPDKPDILNTSTKSDSKKSVKNSEIQGDIESENSNVDDVDNDIISKPENISQECLNYIEHVNRCLKNLTIFKGALEEVFKEDKNTKDMILKVFRDVSPLNDVYKNIIDTIKKMKETNSSFYLYDILHDPVVSNLLNMYKPFLNNYASNAKLIGNFCRENLKAVEACEMAKTSHRIPNNVSIDNCLYTIFNSLFSMELMFDRYRKCFSETSFQNKKGLEAKMVISNLLNSINPCNDQQKFRETQKELNLLSGKSDKAHINTTFIYKGIVTKYARRDDKCLARQLVLFSDCLYVTYLPSSITGTSRVRYELSTDSLEISEIHESNIENISLVKWGININAKEVVQDICFDCEETMRIWKEKLQSVIKGGGAASKPPITNRMSTINESSNDTLLWIGSKAPRWQLDNATSICNGYHCTQRFNTTVRRHHCRCDGLLYCDGCCNSRLRLSFERLEASRVCKLCFDILCTYKNSPKQLAECKKQLHAVFEKINHTGKKTGWLSLRKFNSSKNCFLPENKYFCVLDLKDPFLSLLDKHEDKHKADCIILFGHEIKTERETSSFCRHLSSKQFIIQNSDNSRKDAYLMTATNKEDCLSWVECLRNSILTAINEDVTK